ncbi:MAG: TonB-dependent receptor [Cyanobacteria bacterium P01_B01_bin.77]
MSGFLVAAFITSAVATPLAEDTQAEAMALAEDSKGGELLSQVDDEESEETEEETEEETLRILVTAEKRPEAVQDIPISITVFERQDIQDAGINDFEDVARSTPNFSVFDGSDSRSFLFYSVRGLGNNNFLSRDAVSFYVDDVPYDYGGFIGLDLYDLERVEVLRGPQRTLYGRSAFSGVVNVITQKPTNEYEFGTAARYGNFDDFEVQANVSGPLVEDTLFLRLSGTYSARDGYFDNTLLNEDTLDSSGGSGRLQVRWTPNEDWEVDLNGAFSDYNEDGFPLVAIDDDPFTTEANEAGFARLNTDTQSLRIAYKQPDFQVTSISARRLSRANQASDFDGSALDLGVFSSDFDSTVFTQEVRVQSPEIAERFQWTTGGYFESRQFDTRNDGPTFGEDAVAIFGAPAGTSNFRNSDSDERFWAFFGQASYDVTETLTLTGGLRYENFRAELEDFTAVFTIPGFPAQTLTEFSDETQSGDVWLPRVAAEYRVNPDMMVYGSIAKGYRPGGVNYRVSSPDTLTFESEIGWNFELGAKSTWLDDRLGVNLFVFHTIVDNYQVQIQEQIIGIDRIDNADARITGVELEARATPVEGLDVIAGFGYLDAEFSDYVDEAAGRDFTNNRLPLAPDFTYNLALQYRSPNGFFGRVGVQGTGETFFDEENDFKQSAYAVVNARLGYEFDNTGIYVFANNIFDEEYLTQGAEFLSPIGQYGAPATFGVQVNSRF